MVNNCVWMFFVESLGSPKNEAKVLKLSHQWLVSISPLTHTKIFFQSNWSYFTPLRFHDSDTRTIYASPPNMWRLNFQAHPGTQGPTQTWFTKALTPGFDLRFGLIRTSVSFTPNAEVMIQFAPCLGNSGPVYLFTAPLPSISVAQK